MSGLHTVHVRVIDAATGQPTPVRIRFTGPDGTYYAPFGRTSQFVSDPESRHIPDREWEGSVCLVDGRPRTAAYIDGACEIDLPSGPIGVEITKGPEYRPVQVTVDQPAGKMAMRLSIERWVDLRAERWYAGDMRVHTLTPHAALLEGMAEDVAVVNLLTWRNVNLLAFSGQEPALEKPGHMVVVNTFNTHRVLGQLALLNCHRVVYPLTFGAPDSTDKWTLADWCDQCHRKNGLVVWSGMGYRGLVDYGEPLADLLLGKVDALEMPQLTEGLLREYYGLLDCNLRVPLTGGSGKAGYIMPLGWPRTYARLSVGQEFNYANWIEAVRAGRTFLSAGPLLDFQVNDREPGATVELEGPGTVRLRAVARSIAPFDRIELVVNGVAVAAVEASGSPPVAVIEGELPLAESGWIAARCWGRAFQAVNDPATYCTAHTSPVYLQVAGKPHGAEPIRLAHLSDKLNQLLNWAEHGAQYENDKQRAELTGIFKAALGELIKKAGASRPDSPGPDAASGNGRGPAA